MTSKRFSPPATEVNVADHLRDMNGLSGSAATLAIYFKVSTKAMHFILSGLVQAGLIRQINCDPKEYYLPTEFQLQKERDLAVPRVFKPLVVDKYRHELNESLRAARAATPSIG